MKISLTKLPSEIHNNLSQYLTVLDQTALSVTCSTLQRIYRPLSFQRIILVPRVVWENLSYQYHDFSLSKHARAIPLETFLFPGLFSWYCQEIVRQVKFTHWYVSSSALLLQAQSGDLPQGVSRFDAALYPALTVVNITLAVSDMFNYSSRSILTRFSRDPTSFRFESYFTFEEHSLNNDTLDILNFFADEIGPKDLTLRSVRSLEKITTPIKLETISNFQIDLLNDCGSSSQKGFHSTISMLTGTKNIHIRLHQDEVQMSRFTEALRNLPRLSVLSLYITLGFESLHSFLLALEKLPNTLNQCILGIDFSLWELDDLTQAYFDESPKFTVPLTHLYSVNRNIFVPTDLFFSSEKKIFGMNNARDTNPSCLMTFICSFWKLFNLPRLEIVSIDEYFLPPRSPQDPEPYHKTITQNLPPKKVLSYRILSHEHRYHKLLLRELPLFTSLKILTISHKIPDSFITKVDTGENLYFNDNRRESFQFIFSSQIAPVLGILFKLTQNQGFLDHIFAANLFSSSDIPFFNISDFLKGFYHSIDGYTKHALYWINIILFSPSSFLSDLETSNPVNSGTDDNFDKFISYLCFTEVLFGQIVPNLSQLEFLNLAAGYKSSGAPMVLDSPQFYNMVRKNKSLKQLMFREWFCRPQKYMEDHIYSRYLYLDPITRLDNAANFLSDITGRIVLDLEGLRADAEIPTSTSTETTKRKKFYVEEDSDFRHDLSIGRLKLKPNEYPPGTISVPNSYDFFFSEVYSEFIDKENPIPPRKRCPRCRKLCMEDGDLEDDGFSENSEYSGYGNLDDDENDYGDSYFYESDDDNNNYESMINNMIFEEVENCDFMSSTTDSSSNEDDPWEDIDSDDQYDSDTSSISLTPQLTLDEIEENYPISWFCSNCRDLLEDDKHETTFNVDLYNERDDAYRAWIRECLPNYFWGWL